MPVDPKLKRYLENLNDSVNQTIDRLIKERDSAKPEDKYAYRYILRKLEMIAGASVKALEKC